jgi:hypothetical protein
MPMKNAGIGLQGAPTPAEASAWRSPPQQGRPSALFPDRSAARELKAALPPEGLTLAYLPALRGTETAREFLLTEVLPVRRFSDRCGFHNPLGRFADLSPRCEYIGHYQQSGKSDKPGFSFNGRPAAQLSRTIELAIVCCELRNPRGAGILPRLVLRDEGPTTHFSSFRCAGHRRFRAKRS